MELLVGGVWWDLFRDSNSSRVVIGLLAGELSGNKKKREKRQLYDHHHPKIIRLLWNVIYKSKMMNRPLLWKCIIFLLGQNTTMNKNNS